MSLRPALLDSDILSEIIKAVDPNVLAHAHDYGRAFGRLTITSLSVFEILYGLHRKGATAKIVRAEAVFARNDVLTPDDEDYRLAAEIAAALDRQGTPIGIVDPMIAACALRRGLNVATGNTDHFGYVQKAGYAVVLQNWREPVL